jgi:hypothetical protein
MRRICATSWLRPHLLGYPNGPQLKPDELRRVLTALVERIELEPATREFTIRYRIPVTGVKMASPRGTEPRLLSKRGD